MISSLQFLILNQKCSEDSSNRFPFVCNHIKIHKDTVYVNMCFLLSEVLWASNSFFNLLAKSGTFLTPAEEEHRLVVGKILVRGYAKLASDSVDQKRFLFRLRPKFHLLCHLCGDATRLSRLNPDVSSTWMDEDAVKRWMRVKRQLHRRTASENVIRRFILGLRTNMDRCLRLQVLKSQ